MRRKIRVQPDHLTRADLLRGHVLYHLPDGPPPTRHLLITMALRKGLRSLDALIQQGALPAAQSGSPLHCSTWPRLRIEGTLLGFADRLRGPYYELLQDDDGSLSSYPSRAFILTTAIALGLDEIERLYSPPTAPGSPDAPSPVAP